MILHKLELINNVTFSPYHNVKIFKFVQDGQAGASVTACPLPFILPFHSPSRASLLSCPELVANQSWSLMDQCPVSRA